MSVIDLLDRGLFALSALLRGPIIVLLWICILTVLAQVGAAAVDAMARRRQRSGFDVRSWIQLPPGTCYPERLTRFASEASTLSPGVDYLARLEECLGRHEARARSSSDTLRLLVKVGPSLGLLGTLLPMGSALATLSQGNLEAMSSQMVSAFTSTVIGLGAGTLAFALAALRAHWISVDVREMRFVADLLANGAVDVSKA